MENKLKPPSCQFPSVSDFPIPSPMPNSPQHNKKGNRCYLHNHIGAHMQSHKIPAALPIKLSYSLQKSQQFSQPPLPPSRVGSGVFKLILQSEAKYPCTVSFTLGTESATLSQILSVIFSSFWTQGISSSVKSVL